MSNAKSEQQEQYIQVFPLKVRKGYGSNRLDYKLSLTPATHGLLAKAGIIRRQIGADEKPIAGKGGSGSAFIEMAIEMLLYLMLRDEEIQPLTLNYIVHRIFNLTKYNRESIAIMRQNLKNLGEELEKLEKISEGD